MFLTFLQSSIRFSAVFLFGSVGETLTEKSGNLNLGIPGIMCLGAAGGILGEAAYAASLPSLDHMTGAGAVLSALIVAMLMSCLGGVIYCVLTTSMRCNQNVTGLALTTFGIGVLSFVKGTTTGMVAAFGKASDYFVQSFPIGDTPNWFETLFLSYGFLVYLAIILAVISAIVLKKTRVGLNLRAVGENPATADAAGVSVTRYKYMATIIGSIIAGLGGLFYIMDKSGGNIEDTVDSFGWLAVALVIFTVWRPNWAILGSIVFSVFYILPAYTSDSSNSAAAEAISMLPYLITIVVLVITSIVSKRESQPPASLGLSYFREER